MLELTIRLVASLAVVVGLMLLLTRLVGKRYAGRAGAPVQVLHRQSLSRSAGVAVITVGGRVLVVGTTDHQVSLLTELDPEELADAALEAELDAGLDASVDAARVTDTDPDLDGPAAPVRPAARTGAVVFPSLSSLATSMGAARGPRRPAAASRPTPEDGALAGSVLSAQTWRQAFAAATGKAS